MSRLLFYGIGAATLVALERSAMRQVQRAHLRKREDMSAPLRPLSLNPMDKMDDTELLVYVTTNVAFSAALISMCGRLCFDLYRGISRLANN